MSGLLLSQQERRLFVDYCRNEAASLGAMVEQMKSLSGMEPVSKHYNARRMAYVIVADDLDKVEDANL